jgi:hypothetical protein
VVYASGRGKVHGQLALTYEITWLILNDHVVITNFESLVDMHSSTDSLTRRR